LLVPLAMLVRLGIKVFVLEPLTKPEKEDTTMARIKIKDLPKEEKISMEEMKKTFGGIIVICKPGITKGIIDDGTPSPLNPGITQGIIYDG
jgi:hypothetical protein